MSDEVNLLFLGTGGAPAQKERNQSSILLNYKSFSLFFDFGENVQTQIVKFGAKLRKNKFIILTHLHSDHTLGIMGFLSSKNMSAPTPLTIIGPRGTERFLALQFLAFRFMPLFPIKIIEIPVGDKLCFSDFILQSFPTIHAPESMGYVFSTLPPIGKFNSSKALSLKIPKGKYWKQLSEGIPIQVDGTMVYPSDVLDPSDHKTIKVVITGDTAPSDEVINHSCAADLLIHDATQPSSRGEQAAKYRHSSCLDAAWVAKQANVKQLVLTHLSTLYHQFDKELEKVQEIFPHSLFAYDGLSLTISQEKFSIS